MTPEQIDRVFGRGRLKMVTGEHVEVFREAVAPGERKRYTKRFLNTREGDFGQWTEREWRILARLIGHGITCVPEVVQFDRGRVGGMRIVQTYDAGVTVDQWATLLPVIRDDRVHRHVFEDCAHWWALAHHCLLGLSEIHRLELVHLDIKGDNLCIPYAPVNFDPESADPALRPVFAQFALIDFAFALVSKESLTTPLPIGWQREYDYQSPRLLAALERGRAGDLQATRELDWRCDMYSLAAMLKRYLPDSLPGIDIERTAGWTPERYGAAKRLILAIRESHDSDLPARRPHDDLLATTAAQLAEDELARSLERGWSLAHELTVSAVSASPLTPVTRVAPLTRIATPVHVARSGRTAVTVVASAPSSPSAPQAIAAASPAKPAAQPRRARTLVATLAALAVLATGAALWYAGEREESSRQGLEELLAPVRVAAERTADAATRYIRRDQPQLVAADPVPPAQAPAANAGAAPSPPLSARVADAAKPIADSASDDAQRVRAPMPPPATGATPALSSSTSRPATVASSRGEPAIASTPERASSRAQATYRAQLDSAARLSRPSPRAAAKLDPHTAPNRSPSSPVRAHASWASLQPPAWVTSRNRSPGAPPGFKAQEDTRIGTASTEATPAAATPIRTVPLDPPVATPSPVAATEAPSDSTRAALAQAAVAGSGASDDRRVGARPATPQSLFAARSAAPVEDRSANLAQTFVPAPESRSVATADPPRADDLAAQARRMLTDAVPRIARQGELEVSRVLLIAASAYRPAQDRGLADAARTARIRDEAVLSVHAIAPREARRLHDQARAAFASGRNVREALDLQLRAFAANPRDPEIAGYLAMLYLKAAPPQPDVARQLALVALTARSAQYATTRLEDWQTFAVASALSGREADARNALFVTLALSANVEGSCVSGWNALGNYGERLRGPVEAMLYRVHMRGHSVDSPWCAWPPDWSAPPRLAGELVH